MMISRIRKRLKWEIYQKPGRLRYYLKLFKYKPTRYKESFITKKPVGQLTNNSKIEEKIYCFWTGNNPMSVTRAKCLESMYKNMEIEIVLITPENLEHYILPNAPLHPAYTFLSNVHKSDYLRTYFMHHYGGGYADIKLHKNSWKPFFDKINSSGKNIYGIGYGELSSGGVVQLKGKIGNDLRSNYRYILGNGAYIMKPRTPFTEEWINELHARLDRKIKQLQKHPGNIMGDNPNYPLGWTEILGAVFHPLTLKYHNFFLRDPKLRHINAPYR